MNYPKISIVTPVYNQVQYLEQTILSIINQGYPNLEYIIIDGGSTDGTVDVIRKYESYLTYWVSEPDKGMYHAIQKGFEHSTGEIMCWLNSDDVFFDKCLFAVADIFMHHPEIEWFSARSASIDADGMILGVDNIDGVDSIRFCKYDFYLNRGFWVPQSSTIWRRTIWEKVGATLDTNLRLAGDFDLWLRFVNVAPLYVANTIIGTYRLREGQLSQMMDRYMAEVRLSVKNNPLPMLEMSILKRYERKLTWAARIDKTKIFNGERIVRLRSFMGKLNLKPNVIKYNRELKHF
jgi:glycosyltransferase involved in cell wall biosynthesis